LWKARISPASSPDWFRREQERVFAAQRVDPRLEGFGGLLHGEPPSPRPGSWRFGSRARAGT
jgi:hypothetical protein